MRPIIKVQNWPPLVGVQALACVIKQKRSSLKTGPQRNAVTAHDVDTQSAFAPNSSPGWTTLLYRILKSNSSNTVSTPGTSCSILFPAAVTCSSLQPSVLRMATLRRWRSRFNSGKTLSTSVADSPTVPSRCTKSLPNTLSAQVDGEKISPPLHRACPGGRNDWPARTDASRNLREPTPSRWLAASRRASGRE